MSEVTYVALRQTGITWDAVIKFYCPQLLTKFLVSYVETGNIDAWRYDHEFVAAVEYVNDQIDPSEWKVSVARIPHPQSSINIDRDRDWTGLDCSAEYALVTYKYW